MQKVVTDDLDALLDVLPAHVRQAVLRLSDKGDLLEIVLDLGRYPEARYTKKVVVLSLYVVTISDIVYMVRRMGVFSG
ncbi:MAG: hypothetical protein P8105_04890, partial [Dehalococcoidia bacterium]